MARIMTEPELAAIRSDGQFSELFAAIHNPSLVLSCQVNQAFTTTDRVLEVIFDNVIEGDYLDVLPGMTVWVGTEAGMYDLGFCRVRKDPTSSILYLGENSDIPWDDDVWLTVVDEFGIWPRHLAMEADGTVYMDADIEYDDQHTEMAPVVVLGPPAVIWLTGASVSVEFDASETQCLTPGAISYEFFAPGSSASSGMTTDNPTIEYDTPGVYRVSCKATRDGVIGWGHRYVFVFSDDAPPASFILRSCGGEYESGGWDYEGEIFAEDALFSNLRDRAMVVLFTLDYYNQGEALSIGPIVGRENVISWGWLDTERWDLNPVQGRVAVSIKGPNHWMEQEEGFPLGLENTGSTANAWTNFNELTTNKAVYHWTKWRSTVAEVVDVFFVDDERQASALEAPSGSLWQQLIAITDPIMARPCCDRYGRLFVEINSQYIPAADRTGPDVFTITKADWQESIRVIRRKVAKTSRVDLSGIVFVSNETPQAIFSLSPGHVFKLTGRSMVIDRRLLSDQASSNELAGLILGNENRDYDFEIVGAGNNRMPDICPQQFYPFVIEADDTPRGIAFDGRLVIRSVELTQKENGFIEPRWIAEPETFPENSVNGDIIKSDGVDTIDVSIPPIPSLPALESFPFTYPDPTVANPNQPKEVIIASSTHGVLYTKNFDADPADVVWIFMNAGLDSLDKTTITDLVVTPSGIIFIVTNDYLTSIGVSGASRGRRRIYWAAGLGAKWNLYYDAFTNTTADVPEFVTGISVNPLKSEQIVFHTSMRYALFPDGHVTDDFFSNLNIGSRSGYSTTKYQYTHPFSPPGWYSLREFRTALTFTNNIILMFGSRAGGIASAPVAYWARFTFGGTWIDEGQTGNQADGQPRFGQTIGAGDTVYGWTTGGGYHVWTASGTVQTHHAPSLTSPSFNAPQAVAFSPDGLHGMGADNGHSLGSRFTTDGGATWAAPASAIVGPDVYENCKDNFRWIIGGGINMIYTPDQGATYVNKAGNLLSIAALIDITNIRFLK